MKQLNSMVENYKGYDIEMKFRCYKQEMFKTWGIIRLEDKKLNTAAHNVCFVKGDIEDGKRELFQYFQGFVSNAKGEIDTLILDNEITSMFFITNWDGKK